MIDYSCDSSRLTIPSCPFLAANDRHARSQLSLALIPARPVFSNSLASVYRGQK
ncbi:hypothetical protein OIDMADRAFT_21375 [Oidiodendron maius Zn]|uniref:Uncharacterized protein n=1 Tax=Oidiodendron maius (strain Zn) TaxID=913774 RepID=A0A0C3GVC4_OIDMZ|nr:hypothetical protein OIDMADRAFT_21375 [Oidiodendron maius Zn]